MAVLLVVLLMVVASTQLVSAKTDEKAGVVTGKVVDLGEYKNSPPIVTNVKPRLDIGTEAVEYGTGGHARVRLDTDGDGHSDWSINLYMSQEQYDTIRGAEKSGCRVKLTYNVYPFWIYELLNVQVCGF